MDAYLTIINIIDRLIEKEKAGDMSFAETKAHRHNDISQKQRREVLINDIT